MYNPIFEYINDHFSISQSHYNTLIRVWDYLESKNHSMETSATDKNYLIPCFWKDFIAICNAGDIDLNEKELIKNATGAKLKTEYNR